jgi:ferredoxin
MNKTYTAIFSLALISTSIFAIYSYNNSKTTSISDKNQDEIVSNEIIQVLSILTNRCRGCGKCVRIDPSHFQFNSSSRQAVVISSSNLNSGLLAQAINNCPDRAISLQ